MSGKVRSVYWFNYTSSVAVAVVTPTDHAKSVRSRMRIGTFYGVLCCHFAFFKFMLI